MAFAQGSRSSLTYVREVTFGTTPVSPSMVELPFNSHTLDLSKQAVESAEIRSDRMTNVFRHGNKNAAGDVSFDFRADDYDAILESLFFNTFNSQNELEIGTSLRSLSIEDRSLDINQYRLYKGMVASTGAFTVAPNQMITLDVGFVGKGIVQSGTSADSSPTPQSTNQPFDSFTGTIEDGGSGLAIVTALNFTIDNGVAPTFVIGDDETPQLEYQRAKITGTLTCYYENANLINKFLNETESTLEFSLVDPDGITGNTYTFLMPRIKYNGASAPVQNEQSRTITLPFIALKDDVEGTNIRITKS